MYRIKKWSFSTALLLLFFPGFSYAEQYSIQGSIIDSTTKKNVSFAIVIVQEAGLVVNAPQGRYYVALPKAGKYTVKVQSQGLQVVTTSVTVEGAVTRDFLMLPFTSRGGGVVIRGERDIQKVSRHTMTVKQIKEVPASFGDSLNALTALPSVSRPMGIFGPLIIRGADEAVNGYFIDDIPVFNPMHFGGFHSVINNDLIREIDLYSSAYPSQFANAQGAIININTIDEVDKSGGNVDVGLISASALVKQPITETTYVDGKEKKENKGYVIAAGRVGYLTLFIPLFYEYVLDQKLEQAVEYYDYQFKGRYDLNSRNFLTFLMFGSKDKLDLIYNDDAMEEGDDPLWEDMEWKQNQQSHNAGLYYTFSPGKKFSNTLMGYAAMTLFHRWAEIPKATSAWAKDVGTDSKPYIFGIKDKMKWEWWDSHAEVRGGIEANYYRFDVEGKILLPKEYIEAGFDPNDPNMVVTIELDETIENYTFVHYIENKFTFGWLTLVPGYHSEYLKRTDKWVLDPRGMASITFPTGTTIGAAGGWYSHFLQTNGSYFNETPLLAKVDYLDPQRALHRSVSLEQRISDYTVKLEGFSNRFRDIVDAEEWTDTDGTVKNFRNNGKMKTYGFEIMAKVSDEKDQGLFGWTSYTYTKAKYKSGLVSDTYGDEWISAWSEQIHVMKAVTGYTFGNHTVSGRFQFNSTLPYTPVAGSNEDVDYFNSTGKRRYVPVYGKTNSKRLSPEHRLDLRYSYKTNYKWGHVSWYVEIINAYNFRGEELKYDYTKGTWKTEKSDEIAMIPNFGVEAKF
ncbi:MAG TPA: TonB-dependent receptor plug domain-containing protein [Spirochaetota bacterium]|nr:TonB-dependent receptor plug domain-containing protein [Spirochaetota bacterium]